MGCAYVPLVLNEERGICRPSPTQKFCVEISFVLAGQGRVGQKCRHLAAGSTCCQHVGDIPGQDPQLIAVKRTHDRLQHSTLDGGLTASCFCWSSCFCLPPPLSCLIELDSSPISYHSLLPPRSSSVLLSFPGLYAGEAWS